jgi:hypothetical protein
MEKLKAWLETGVSEKSTMAMSLDDRTPDQAYFVVREIFPDSIE